MPHALVRVVVFAPFADVVKQQREHQQLRRLQLARESTRTARGRASACREPLEVADRQQRVLVDRVLVIEVADDAAVDRLELGEDPAEQPAIVHLREPRVEARPRLQELAAAQSRSPAVGEEVVGA